MLIDHAQGLVARHIPATTAAQAEQAIIVGARRETELGWCQIQDAGGSYADVTLMRKLYKEGRVKLRIYKAVYGPGPAATKLIADGISTGEYDQRFTLRTIKVVMDGALGSRGAWLLEPYSDQPGSTGLETTPLEVVNEVADLAAKNGFQLCIHAIGDRANREVLNVYERVYRAHPGEKLRWRIEHAQHLNPADIPRFGKLGVIAAMQGIHCTSDGPWVTARLGAKRAAEGAYVWQSLMRSGAIVGNGTDCPVEDVDPIACFYASVSRRLKDGSVFYPDQRMSRAEALKSYTWNNAYAAFEEDVKGSLTPGKLGDVTVFSKDLMTVPEEEIPNTHVVMTIVGGKIVYRTPELPAKP
jgi:predicted amidohydrolase YtcJ